MPLRPIAIAALLVAGCAAPVIHGGDAPDLAVAAGDVDAAADLATTRDLASLPDLSPPTDLAGLGPPVYSSPSPAPALWASSYSLPLAVTLAATDPTTTIYYTTDGAAPSLSSPHAVSPVAGLAIGATSMLRYFGVNSNGQGPTTSDAYLVDATQQSKAGYLATDIKLDGTSPVVVATPGQVFNAVATFKMWVQSSCPLCSAQLVFGVDTTDQGCLSDSSPGVYPGVSATAAPFTVTAPMTSGVHEVRLAHIEQTTCATAMAAGALATRPNLVRIGVIVVP